MSPWVCAEPRRNPAAAIERSRRKSAPEACHGGTVAPPRAQPERVGPHAYLSHEGTPGAARLAAAEAGGDSPPLALQPYPLPDDRSLQATSPMGAKNNRAGPTDKAARCRGMGIGTQHPNVVVGCSRSRIRSRSMSSSGLRDGDLPWFFWAAAGVPPHLGQTKLPAATPTNLPSLRLRSLALLGRARWANQREGALNQPVFRWSSLAVALLQFGLVCAGKPLSAKSTSAGLRRSIPIRGCHIQFYFTSEVIPQPPVVSVLERGGWADQQEGALHAPVWVRPGFAVSQNS